ncbi:hypothetical protein JCM11491_003700 [Sporobolomyces phaffii]
MASTRDRITLERLVRVLDATSSPPSDHLTHLKLQATVKHARELLAAAREHPDAEVYPPSTSRNAAPPRDSLADFDARISRADRKLADSWELVSATSRPSTPDSGGLDLEFLLPTLPPSMPLPRPDRPTSPSSNSPTKRTKRDGSTLLHATSPPTSSIEHESSSRPASPSLDLLSRPSDLSSSTTSSGLRHRTAPPWLRNRQLKEQEREREREQAEAREKEREKEKGKATLVNSTVKSFDDLVPAGTSSVTSSDLLSHHHALQSSLLGDLTSLSSALKASSQTFSDNLQKDKEVMQLAEKQLEGNEGRMKVQQERLKGVRGKTRGTTCWTLGILVVVAAMWIGVFLLIKVT